MKSCEFIKFQQFSTSSEIIGFSEKVDFLDFGALLRNFHPFRVKKRRHQLMVSAQGVKWMEFHQF